MNFLKKLGQILASAALYGVGAGPIAERFLGSGKASAIVSTAVNDLTQIAALVTQAEAMLQNTAGPDRMKAVLPLITNVIKTSEVVSGKKIANETQFNQGCQEVAQGVFDILSSIHEDSAKA